MNFNRIHLYHLFLNNSLDDLVSFLSISDTVLDEEEKGSRVESYSLRGKTHPYRFLYPKREGVENQFHWVRDKLIIGVLSPVRSDPSWYVLRLRGRFTIVFSESLID